MSRQRWSSMFKNIPLRRGTRIWPVLYWLPSFVVATQYIFNIKYISGRSMQKPSQPTLNPDSSRWRDIGLFNRFDIHSMHNYKRDDIVCLRSPEYKDRVLIKRILAVEGDTVRTLPPYPTREVRIPPGHVWVEGDEPFNSDDSNRFGPVPAALLESRLILLLWPLDRIGQVKIETPSTTSGPQYRQAVAQLEREKSRRMRVTRCKKDRIEVE